MLITYQTRKGYTLKSSPELKAYYDLKNRIDEMVEKGLHPNDPVLRSMSRHLWKLYTRLTQEEQASADFVENIYFS